MIRLTQNPLKLAAPLRKDLSRRTLLACVVLAAGVIASCKPAAQSPLYDEAYIVLYGRPECSACKDYQKDLDDARISYAFKNIDDTNVQQELYSRMNKAGLNTSYFELPVIDVNGKIAIRPELREVIKDFNKPVPKCAGDQGKRLCQWVSKLTPKELVKTTQRLDPLQVTGITDIRGELCAVMGEKIVRKGDKIGRYEVAGIQPDSVTLKDADGKTLVKKYG